MAHLYTFLGKFLSEQFTAVTKKDKEKGKSVNNHVLFFFQIVTVSTILTKHKGFRDKNYCNEGNLRMKLPLFY